jgi:hypothetical protein
MKPRLSGVRLNNQFGRSVTLNEPEQDRRLRWWGGHFARELPPLTVNAPGVWHVRGTSHACRGDHELSILPCRDPR